MCSKTNITEIRPARLEDKEPVMTMLEETNFFRPEELRTAEEVFDDSLSCGLDGEYRSYVATEKNKTVGWVCLGPTACTVGTFDIYWVAVDPKVQNKGIGKNLMNFTTELIKKCGGRMIAAETSGNPRYISTRRFYEKLGYSKEACIKDFYTPGDDKIIYIRKVDSC